MRRVLGALMLLAAGCGTGDGLVSVAGTVTVNNQPAGNAAVTFIPLAGTPGNGGTALADSSGRYEIMNAQGQKGLPPGKYKVTISRRLNADGSTPDPNVPPIESQARETLPPHYTDPEKTELTADVSAGDKRSFDFTLTMGKRKN
jgi:hypothetical protein